MNFFRGNFYQSSLTNNINRAELNQDELDRLLMKAEHTIETAQKVGAGPGMKRYREMVN